QAAAVYREVERTHGRAPLSAVLVPLPAREGLLCALDERFTTLLLEAAAEEEPGPRPGGELHGAILRRSGTAVRCPLGAGSSLQAERVPRLVQAALQSRGLAPRPADEPPERAVAAHLAAALAEAAGLAHDAARRAADTLLDPACYPVDYPASVPRPWPCP